MATFQGNGTTITFTGAPTGMFGEIINVSWDGGTRDQIESSHFGTTGSKTFVGATLVDNGSFSVELQPDMTIAPQTALSLSGSVAIGFTDPASKTWTFQGNVQDGAGVFPMNDRVTQTIGIKISGDVSVSV